MRENNAAGPPALDDWQGRVHPDDAAALREMWRRALCSPPMALAREFRFRRPDGSERWILMQCFPETATGYVADVPAPPTTTAAAASTASASPAPSAAGVRHERTASQESVVRGLVCAFTDLTAHKQLEVERLQALEEAARTQAQRANEAEQHRREQERLVDIICHEIRNPLNGIINTMDLLKTARDQRMARLVAACAPGAPPLDVPAMIAQLRDEEPLWVAVDLCTQHQRRITDDVLHLSRLSTGYFAVEEREFSLRETVDTSVGMVRAEAESAHVALQVRYGPGSERVHRLAGDPQRISQVLINFLANAIKFTRPAPVRRVTVVVDVYAPPPPPEATAVPPVLPPPPADGDATAAVPVGEEVWVALCVADTGIGMSVEEQTRLFLPFRQANVKTYTTYGGSGMGLFICKAIAELLHGEIRVRSAPGEGSCFMLLVPCRRAEAPAESPPVPSSARTLSRAGSPPAAAATVLTAAPPAAAAAAAATPAPRKYRILGAACQPRARSDTKARPDASPPARARARWLLFALSLPLPHSGGRQRHQPARAPAAAAGGGRRTHRGGDGRERPRGRGHCPRAAGPGPGVYGY